MSISLEVQLFYAATGILEWVMAQGLIYVVYKRNIDSIDGDNHLPRVPSPRCLLEIHTG